MLTITTLATLFVAGLAFCVASIVYVYRYRGTLRYAGFGEYVRKGWPIFSPLNCLLYLATDRKAKRPIMDVDDFPDLQPLRDNWEVIREEALQLYQQGTFDRTNDPDNKAYYDIGFRTFFKYGWSKFYLKWYGYTHASARELCPRTVELVGRTKSVNGAMFSILPPGSKLTRHLDPVACSLRFHLGLSTPNDDRCFINVDDQIYSWRDGEALLFDETYLHHAHNDAEEPRLILMCDVERPMSLWGRFVNFFNKLALRMSVVPNTEADRRGLANALFSTLAPLLARSKALKQRNKALYRLVKWSVNLSLAFIVLALVGGALYGVYRLIDWALTAG